MAHIRGVNLSNDGLIFSVDARNRKSYAGTGTSLNNLKHINKDATLNNSPALVSSAKFTIDGTDDYISFPQSSLFENQNFTINLWCKLGSVNNLQAIFHYGNASDLTKGIFFYTNNGTVNFTINDYTTNIASYSFSDTTNVRMWTLTYDSSNLRIYLDGTQVAIQSQTATVDYTGANGGAVFALENGSFFKDGEFHNLQIYNQALSATEIRNNYLATSGGIGVALGAVPPTSPSPTPSPTYTVLTDNLWIDLRPDDYSGTTVNDQSGNGRHATMSNGAVVTTTPTGEDAFYTDGVNDYVLYETSSNPSTGFPFSWESWLYRDDTLSGFVSPVVGKPTNSRYNFFDGGLRVPPVAQTAGPDQVTLSTAAFRWYAEGSSTNSYDGNSQLELYLAAGAGGVSVNDFATSDHTWYHLVCVFTEDASGYLGMDCYINGTQIFQASDFYANADTRSEPPRTNVKYPWEGTRTCQYGYGYFERYSTADIYRNMYAGDFRLYTDALTSSEVLNNFNATKSRFGY